MNYATLKRDALLAAEAVSGLEFRYGILPSVGFLVMLVALIVGLFRRAVADEKNLKNMKNATKVAVDRPDNALKKNSKCLDDKNRWVVSTWC